MTGDVSTLTEIAARRPAVAELCGDIRHATSQIRATMPLVRSQLRALAPSGPKSPSFAMGRSVGSTSDPTMSTVTGREGRQQDAVDAATVALRAAHSDIAVAWRIVECGGDPRPLLEEVLAGLRRTLGGLQRLLPRPASARSSGGDPGCRSCRRIKDPRGLGPWFNPTAKRDGGRGGLCRRCDDYRRSELADAAKQGRYPNAASQKLWPPIRVLEMWRDSITVTPARLAEAKAAQRALPAEKHVAPSRGQKAR
jgi:hypothetical protein